MSSQDKVKNGPRKSSFCGHFMAEWESHHYCPKCRDDLKGDDPCVKSTECTICSAFSEEQKKKIRNRNGYKSKKDQGSSLFGDNNKDGSIDDSLLDKDESSATGSSQVLSSQKNRSLEDKLDRFFTEFQSLLQKLQNLEHKEAETVSSHTSSGRDGLYVAKQPVETSKSHPASVASVVPGRLDRRSATITRAEFDQQSSANQTSGESGHLASSRKRSFSQSSEEPDPDLEQGEICSKEEDAPAYSDTLETIKKWLDLEVKDVECFVPPSVFSGRDQVKKSMALPPAQPLVDLWKFKEFSALGSNN